MKGKRVFLSILFAVSVLASGVLGQNIPVNEYGLRVVDSPELYQELVQKDSTRQLVDLEGFIPGIHLDIKYATDDNFMGKQLYPAAKAYLRLPAARALKAVQAELQSLGLELKVYDGYRPYRVTVAMWEPYKDPRYVADPASGSRHNRGCAVDVTLISLKTGEELPMPTGYDDFSEQAHHDYTDLPAEVLKNRYILKTVMERHGFAPISSEWWHYDYSGWQKYHLMDIPFSELSVKEGTR
ncbi:MAG: D-alanyl-D-alanine dipeptidase [Candidatus Marinimicrobia bacterium]|nr:D-alanyl-D-alanine dipeptidase [Candidatus Neomarinimicrobiota bacterium]